MPALPQAPPSPGPCSAASPPAAATAQSLRKQRTAATAIAADNAALKEELMLENRFSVCPTTQAAAALIAALQAQADAWAAKVGAEGAAASGQGACITLSTVAWAGSVTRAPLALPPLPCRAADHRGAALAGRAGARSGGAAAVCCAAARADGWHYQQRGAGHQGGGWAGIVVTMRAWASSENCIRSAVLLLPSHAQAQRRIRVLEDRLQQASVRYNNLLTRNSVLRGRIDGLRRESMLFKDLHAKLQHGLKRRNEEMAEVIMRIAGARDDREKVGAREMPGAGSVPAMALLQKRRHRHQCHAKPHPTFAALPTPLCRPPSCRAR